MREAPTRGVAVELDVQILCVCCGASADPVPAPCGHCFCLACEPAKVHPSECPICVEKLHPIPASVRNGSRHAHP